MSDTPKTVTEREAVQLQRAAYLQGVQDRVALVERCNPANVDAVLVRMEDGSINGSVKTVGAAAKHRFPLPKTTRLRTRTDSTGVEWRVKYGVLEFHGLSAWYCAAQDWCVTPERAALWADLFANPTEEVEEEA